MAAEETGLGFVLDRVVERCFAAFVGVSAEDGDEVGCGFYAFEKCGGAGLVTRLGPTLTAFDFVIAVGVIPPAGIAT